MNYKTIVFLFITAFFVSCTSNPDQHDYVDWIENTDNGLRIERTTSSAEYVLQYEPSLYKALSQVDSSTKMDLAGVAESFENMHHFILRIKPMEQSFSEKQEMSEYLAFDFRKKIRFTEGLDTLDRTVMYHLESSGGITPYQRILIAYPKSKGIKPLSLIIEPNKLEPKAQKFTFDKESLEDLKSLTSRIQTGL